MIQQVRGLGKETFDLSGNLATDDEVDWTSLDNHIVIQLFSFLSYRDRASLSSTCRKWSRLGISKCLWESLDLSMHKITANTATLLAARCANLRKLRFHGAESAEALIYLQARGLKEISGDNCGDICGNICGDNCGEITDATLNLIASQHNLLENLQLGRKFCQSIISVAIAKVAVCCPKLQKLRLSGIRDVGGDAINALARNCPNLTDIGFIDCLDVDMKTLGNVLSLRFLSVAGTLNVKIDWSLVSEYWSKLPNLKCLDISRTGVTPNALSTLILDSENLKILCALDCPALKNIVLNRKSIKGKLLITPSSNIFKGVVSLFSETKMKERNAFSNWRNSNNKDRDLDETMTWLEWVLSHSLVCIAETTTYGWNHFWLKQGIALLLNLAQSSQEDVQERALEAIAIFSYVGKYAEIDSALSEAVIREGGILILLQLAKSWREGLQSGSTRAIRKLMENPMVRRAVIECGGIRIFINLTRSMCRMVAEEAVIGVLKLSVYEEHQDAIAEAGVVQALVDVIFKWSTVGYFILECAVVALANIAMDDKGSMLVTKYGGLHALAMLAQSSNSEIIQERVAYALGIIAAPRDCIVAVGQDVGLVEAIVHLLRSPNDGVRSKAADAFWGLSYDKRNMEAIASAGGVDCLVALGNTCSNANHGLQKKVSGALLNISVSESHRYRHEKILHCLQLERRNNEDISTSHQSLHSPLTSSEIGRKGGIALLIALAQSEHEDVRVKATVALAELSINPSNALWIVEDGGVPVLLHLCYPSMSKLVQYSAALALTCIFDSRMSEFYLAKVSSESDSECIIIDVSRRLAMKFIEDFIFTSSNLQTFSAVAASASALLTQVTELAPPISEAEHPKCRELQSRRYADKILRVVWHYLYYCLSV